MKTVILLISLCLFSSVSWAECIEGDCVNGSGTYSHSNGQKYVGQWKDNYQHGQGTHTWPDGHKYVGQWEDNNQHGQGTMTYPDGHKYVGQYKYGKRHGQGTMTYAGGQKYVGQWSDDVKTGQGTHTWPSGQKYVGQWKDNNEHGRGTMTYPDGPKYVGQWKDGAPVRDLAKEARLRKAAEAERLRKAAEAERLLKVAEAERLRKAAEAERLRKAAEAERLLKVAEAERLRKAAEEKRDSDTKLVLIILLFGIAAIFLVIKILRPSKNTEGAGVGGYTIKIVLSLIFFIFLWAPFLSPIFTDAIEESRYVVYGGESEALLAAILSSAIWIAGMAPLLWFWNKKRTANHVAASSSASEAQSTQGSKSSDELQPLKMIQAAQIADEVSSNADIDSVIQVASILSSEKEIMQAVQEANEDLRDAYETKVKDLFEKQGIDKESLTATAIQSEVNRCMKLGLNKICLDERLVPLLGSQK